MRAEQHMLERTIWRAAAISPVSQPVVVGVGPSSAAPSFFFRLPAFEQPFWDLRQLLLLFLARVVFQPPRDAIALGAWTPLAGQLSFDQFQLFGPAFVVLLSRPLKMSA